MLEKSIFLALVITKEYNKLNVFKNYNDLFKTRTKKIV